MQFDPVERRAYIGASEAPAALGASPYSGDTPLRLWRIKTGRDDPPDLSGEPRIQLGTAFQSAIIRHFHRAHGYLGRVRELGDHEQATHPKEAWLRARSDAWVEFPDQPPAIGEAKFYNDRKRAEFGEVGTDDVPLYAALQCVHEAVCFNVETVYFFALFGNSAFGWWKLTFDQASKDAYVQQAAKFGAYVQTDTPPPPSHAADVLAMHPRDDGSAVQAGETEAGAYSRLLGIRTQRKALEEQEDALANLIKVKIGAGSSLVWQGQTLATWKAPAKDVQRFDTKLFQQHHPDLYKKYTVAGPGARRLLLKGE